MAAGCVPTVLFGLLVLVTVASAFSFSEKPFLWPQPSAFTYGNTTLSLQRSKFSISLDSNVASSQLLSTAADRYFGLIFNHAALSVQVTYPPAVALVAANDSLIVLKISVASTNETLNLQTDESYNLTIPNSSADQSNGLTATISANTVFGALRGMETFSQLVRFDGDDWSVPFAPISIQDTPRFPWRGLLIDTARHFHPVWSLKHQIDAMSYSKLNVLHWHMTDAESFPLELKKRPDLANKGAWASGFTYSAADVADVIEYAKNRGVRVVVEIDNPGHTYSWGKGFPQIIALCQNLVQSSNTYPEINFVPLDITNPLTAQVVADVLSEAASMFPDEYIHLGGDEINFDCLNELPRILQWMQTNLNSSNYQDLIAYHLNQSVPNVLNQGKKAVFWQEVFTMVLNNPAYNLPIKAGNTVVQVWFGGPQYYQLLQKAISMGFETLMSYGWYLDQQFPSITGEKHYLFQDTWMDFYAVDPMTGLENATEAEKRLVLGGEASQWGETAHPYAIDENVWPRAAATAEKLWSPQSATQNPNEAYHRFIRHQCRLVQRGVRASSFRPNFCPSPFLDAEISNARAPNSVTLPIWVLVVGALVIVLFGTMTVGFYLRSRSAPRYQQLE